MCVCVCVSLSLVAVLDCGVAGGEVDCGSDVVEGRILVMWLWGWRGIGQGCNGAERAEEVQLREDSMGNERGVVRDCLSEYA